MTTGTLDTGPTDNPEIFRAAKEAGVQLAHTSITDRELRSSDIVSITATTPRLLECLVLGESELGGAVLASPSDGETLDVALHIISNGSFPRSGMPWPLTLGQLHQLRDAMILAAHVRDRRDIFITADRKAFISQGRRELIEKRFNTKVMTPEEFLDFCQRR